MTVGELEYLPSVLSADVEQRVQLLNSIKPRVTDQYTKHIPHPTQQLFLLQSGQEVLYGGAAGGGKRSNVCSNVLTPKGWKRIGDVVAGDVLVDPRTGRSQTVLIAHPVVTDTVWEVEFEDGAVHECHGEHLWAVRMSGKRTKGWDTRRSYGEVDPWLNGYKVVTTEILAQGVERAREQQARGSRPNWPHIPVPRAVEFTRPYRNIHVTLPVDPYVLGIVLGDGGASKNKRVWVCGDDDEVHDRFTRWARSVSGNKVVTKGRTPDKPFRTSYVSDAALWAVFDRIGVANKVAATKRIPEDYLYAPLSWRYGLMQGLMDTDGYVDDRGHMSYTTVSEGLARDVAHLARSLGARVSVTTKTPTYTYNGDKKTGQLAYTVWIVAHDPSEFVTVPRKRDRLKLAQHQPARQVTAVRKTGRTAQMRCITVDTIDGLYITDDFIVTHNSDALLMSALQYVDVPGYSALLLRRTWPDLSLPGAIMDRAREWLQDTDAVPKDGGRTWVFPSQARITFGYLQYDKDKYRYQSAEFQFIGFDELTQFGQDTYEYMFSRIRRPNLVCLRCRQPVRKYQGAWKHTSRATECRDLVPDPKTLQQYGPSPSGLTLFDVPLRMRSATNPGGVGHTWVRDRFIATETKVPDAIFIPATLADNPSLDQETYRENLAHLNPVDRERLMNGDWDVMEEGAFFQRHWFKFLSERPADSRIRWTRYWDLAATAEGDWTAGCLLGLNPDGEWIVADVRRMRGTPREVERFIEATAIEDGRGVPIRMEQEPGSSGVMTIDYYRRKILVGYDFRPDKKVGDKQTRANPVSSAAEAGNIWLVAGQWNRDFLDEVSLFPYGAHDDQCDAFTGAFSQIVKKRARILA